MTAEERAVAAVGGGCNSAHSGDGDGDPRVVATCCDDRYLWPWACTVYSAVRGAQRRIRVLHANVNGLLSPGGRDVAERLIDALQCTGAVVEVSVEVTGSGRFQWNDTIFARLALMDTQESPFLWLDSDTICAPGWTAVFDQADALMQDPGKVVCAVVDREATRDALRAAGSNAAYRAAGDGYVNSGVIYADPVRWRQRGMPDAWPGLVPAQRELGFEFVDQDLVNYLLAGHIGFFGSTFNHIVSEETRGGELIFHYAGYPKPWKLSEAGRAVFVAIEATNFDRPEEQLTRGGRAWEQFPRYWEVERALVATLRERGFAALADELLARRDAEVTPLSRPLRAKLWAMRVVSRNYQGRLPRGTRHV